ncbi:hypothetical protein [Desulfoferrobacter suflitae]|uniref:hypothetical protein n=1 Tax=Desulfoferrobacter suflitae TaxID=2865782 RepID=UPI0021649CB0|nr:hypothetical protein [Desulfoferrobacter suflitae]MCK8604186.1 hypothetical protein [Desulfoferrobacter suflitae]
MKSSRRDPFNTVFALLVIASVLTMAGFTGARAQSDPKTAIEADSPTVSPGIHEAMLTLGRCGVPPDAVSRMLAAIVDGTISPDDVPTLLSPLLAACRRNLPVIPLVEKLEEGLAKREPASKIEAALDRMIQQYGFVHSLLSKRCHDLSKGETDMITAFASLLNKGIAPKELEHAVMIHKGTPLERILLVLQTRAYLAQINFEPAALNLIFEAGLRNRSFDDQWIYLPRAVVACRKRGLSDKEIAQATAATLKNNGSLREFLDQMGFTRRELK